MANYDYAVLISGNGDTTRANVEALFEDYVLSKKGKGALVLAFDAKPSGAQIWAGQMATQHNVESIIVSPPSGLLDSVPKGSFVQAPQGDAMAIGVSVLRAQAEDIAAFIVWSDDDNDSVQTLAECKMHKVPAFDLTNGLCSIIPAEGLVTLVPPEMPLAEMIVAPVKNVVTGELLDEIPEEDTEEGSEEEEEVEDTAEIIYSAIYAFAELVAELVTERIKDTK